MKNPDEHYVGDDCVGGHYGDPTLSHVDQDPCPVCKGHQGRWDNAPYGSEAKSNGIWRPCPECGDTDTRPTDAEVEAAGHVWVELDEDADPRETVERMRIALKAAARARPTTDAGLNELSDRIENLEQGIWRLHGLPNVREEPGGEHVNAIRYCGECKREWPCPTVKLNTEAWQAAAAARQETDDD